MTDGRKLRREWLKQWQGQWLGQPRTDLIAGLVVALALIPEAIAFSLIAGVDPSVGLYASVCIAIVSAFAGGRPAMISAATGAMALVMADLVRDHGLNYLLACTILTGLLQIGAGLLRLERLMRFVSHSVMTGFVNALALLIFFAQLPEFIGASREMFIMVALGLGLLWLWPRVTGLIPGPLVLILLATGASLHFGFDLRTVGDLGELPHSLPVFALPDVPLTAGTLKIILPYALTLTLVGLLESLLTAGILDEKTDSSSDKNREVYGQGLANITAGCFGGMAGCAMIGQSVINVSCGARGRLSTFAAGVILMALLLLLQEWVARIPMAALVAIMIMVAAKTFDWNSLKSLRRLPASSSLVMLTTLTVTVATRDLSLGVLAGVLMSALFFMAKVARLVEITSTLSADGRQRRYVVRGALFFGSANAFADGFDPREPLDVVEIDLTAAHLWDITAVRTLEQILVRFRDHGVAVRLLGLNAASAGLLDRVGQAGNRLAPTR